MSVKYGLKNINIINFIYELADIKKLKFEELYQEENMKKLELDVHTHTIASGHAYATILEMAKEASLRGIKLLGITEHTQGIPGACDDFYFANLRVVPREMFGIELMLGAEINILDYDGNLSFPDENMYLLDLRIAGIHKFCYNHGTIEENTRAIVNTIKNPQIDIISHPDDGNCPLDYETVVKVAKDYHTLLEVNNNSLKNFKSRKNVFENSITLLKLCKQYKIPVLFSSDAHFTTGIGNTEEIEKVLKEVEFPEDLVINYSVENFKNFIRENRENRKHLK